MIGLGSGYRPYEFAGFGEISRPATTGRKMIALILELLHTRRTTHQGPSFHATIVGEYAVFPVSVQQPHPPLFMAAGSDRSLAYAARHGFGLMLSTLPSFETLARQVRFYREHVQEARAPLNQNPACGHVDRGALGLRRGDRCRGQTRHRSGHRPAHQPLPERGDVGVSRQRVGEAPY